MAQTGNLGEKIDTIGQVVELRIFCSEQEQLSVNVRHFQVIARAGVGVTQSIVAAYYAAILPALMKALLPATARYRGLSVRRLFPGALPTECFDDTGNGVGDVAGEALPKQVAGLLSFYSVTAGRSGRGRLYAPFPAEEDNDSTMQPTAGYVVRLSELGDALTGVDEPGGAGNTVQLQSVLYARDSHITTTFLTWKARDRWATQRRRGDYGRTNSFPV